MRYEIDPEFRQAIDTAFSKCGDTFDEFAVKHGLIAEKWYHDLPIWVLSWEESDYMTRNIYLGPIETPEGHGLAAVSFAYRDVPGARYGLSDAKVVASIPGQTLRDNPEDLTVALEKALEISRNIQTEELIRYQ